MTLVAAVFASAVLAEAGMTGTTEVTLRPTKDSTVSEADPGMNFGSNSSLLVGEFQGDEWITYTDWDFGEIPAGVTIEEVEMRFVRGCTGFTDPIAIQLRNIDSGWSESGVRWNNRPGLSSIAGVSAILLPNCTGATDLIVFESPNSDPLIDWVQGIVDGGTSNGMAFIAPSGSPLAAIESSEGDDGVSLFVTYSKDAAPPEITLVEQLDEIDSDADGFVSEVTFRWEVDIASGSDSVFCAIDLREASSVQRVFTSDVFTITPSGRTLGQEFNVTADLPPNVDRGSYVFEIKLIDADTNDLIAQVDRPVLLEPGSDVLADSDRLPDGDWTVVIHGLTDTGYGLLSSPFGGNAACNTNWMWRMADKIRRESALVQSVPGVAPIDSNVRIRTHSSNQGTILDEFSVLLGDPTDGDHHQVLLVDWAGVSNLLEGFPEPGLPPLPFVGPPAGAQGDDGYAEATADALYALLRRYRIEDNVHAIIGYSRGAVVSSELAQRLLLASASNTPDQIVYIDGEGGFPFVDNSSPVYSDNAFFAWNASGLATHNYYQSFRAGADLGWLGAEPKSGASDVDIDDFPTIGYSHSDAYEHLITGSPFSGCGTNVIGDPSGEAGLFVHDQRLITAALPGGFTGPRTAIATDAPALFEILNGDFDRFNVDFFSSLPTTAGWWYHGGSPTGTESVSQLGGITDAPNVPNGTGVMSDRVLALHPDEFRRHNWMAVPPGAHSVRFDVAAESVGRSTGTQRLTVEWWPTIGGASVVSEWDIFPGAPAVRLRAPFDSGDRAGLLVFRNGGGSAGSRLLIDNVEWSSASADTLVELGLTPDTIALQAGANGSATVDIARLNATGDVALSAASAPPGIDVSFSPPVVSGNSAVAAVGVAPGVAPGVYQVAIDGQSTGTAVESVTLTVDVRPAPMPLIAITESSGDLNDNLLEFPDTQETDGASQFFAVSNDGDATLIISQIEVIDEDIITDQGTSTSAGAFTPEPEISAGATDALDPGESLLVEVRFLPNDVGLFRGVLRVQSNDPTTDRIDLALEGRGLVRPPAVPVYVAPLNNDTVRIPVFLEWEITRDAVVYDVYVSDAAGGPLDQDDLVASVSNTFFRLTDLSEATQYRWRIDARNDSGVTPGATWTFTTAVNTCLGDFDNDGDVDLGDFGIFGAAFNTAIGDPNYESDADFDNDGDVDLGDFGVFGSEFARTDCFG